MFWQIILEGFDNLNGGPLSEFIASITGNAGLEFVALTEFEGSGVLEPIYRLDWREFTRVEEFVPAVSQLIQVDWATLVFSKTALEKLNDNDEETRFAKLLADGLTVVRFADGQYVYVFTGDDALKEYICRHYECQEIDKLAPQNFEWSG